MPIRYNRGKNSVCALKLLFCNLGTTKALHEVQPQTGPNGRMAFLAFCVPHVTEKIRVKVKVNFMVGIYALEKTQQKLGA